MSDDKGNAGRFAGGNTPPADQGTRDPDDTRNHMDRINPDDGVGASSLRGGSVKTPPVPGQHADGLHVQRPNMPLPPADQPATRPYQLLEAAFIRDMRYAAGSIVHLMPHEVGPHMVPVDTVGVAEDEVARKQEVLDAAQRDLDAAVERHDAAKSAQGDMSADDEQAKMDQRFAALHEPQPVPIFGQPQPSPSATPAANAAFEPAPSDAEVKAETERHERERREYEEKKAADLKAERDREAATAAKPGLSGADHTG
ncbi:MAG: hypothetical protein ABI196_00595 [Bradyrhizobium sp.]